MFIVLRTDDSSICTSQTGSCAEDNNDMNPTADMHPATTGHGLSSAAQKFIGVTIILALFFALCFIVYLVIRKPSSGPWWNLRRFKRLRPPSQPKDSDPSESKVHLASSPSPDSVYQASLEAA